MRLQGFGYWSGEDVTVEFRPAQPDTGIVFVRRDLDPPQSIHASVEHRVEIPRRTALRRGAAFGRNGRARVGGRRWTGHR